MKFLLLAILLLSLTGCATTPPATPMTGVQPVGGIYHKVQAGETLWRISKLYDIGLDRLVKANSIQDKSQLTKGELLFIPGIHKKKEIVEDSITNDSFLWPVSGTVVAFFGARVDKVRNKGIDIRASIGNKVMASRSGKVVFCDDRFKGYGRTVILDHGDSYQTVYAYNSEILVKVGDSVDRGRTIARVGSTGRAKEPSLHFEIRKDGVPQNPFYYLPR
ncbi:MAG: peptidoglycan DD-metalloendopeptidase family protein [Candidatus Omnitrophica bacterium]|nr:peptidoglycan DD-metalloendopeptidase family protein [Candidatus Omnitrophota bacterium]